MTAVFVITPKGTDRGKHIRRLKQKHWMDFYHYMMMHCQYTFQYNQLVKVHVTPLKK